MNLKCIFCNVVFTKEELGKNQEQLLNPSFNRIALKYFGLDFLSNWDLTLICVDSNEENEGIKVPLPLCLPCSGLMINLIHLDTQLESVQSQISQLVANASLSIIDRFSSSSTQDSVSITIQRLQNDEIQVLEEETSTNNTFHQEQQQDKDFINVAVEDGEEKELKEFEPGFEIRVEHETNQTESNNDVQVHVINVDNSISQVKEHLVVDDFVSEKVHSLRKIVFDHYKPYVILNTYESQDDSSEISSNSKSIKKIPTKRRKRGRPRKEPVKIRKVEEEVDDDPEFSISNIPVKTDDDCTENDDDEVGEEEIEEECQDNNDPDYSDNDDDNIISERPRKKRKVAKKKNNSSSNNANNKSDNTITKKHFRSTKEIENGIHLYRKWTFKEVETGFICLTCPLEKQKVRKNRTDCIKHINKRHNMDRARCDKCRRTYRNDKLLESHQCHPKPITRVYRVKNIGDGKFLYDDTFPFEQIENTVEYKCGTCLVIKRGHGYMTAHIKETHAEPTKYLCMYEDCGKSFEKLKLFKNHQNTHSEICVYTCESCGKQCKTQGLLKAHQMMHASLAFKCDGCERSFKYKKSLNRHRKDAGHAELTSNIDIRPLHALSCNLCHKKFLTQKTMNQHALSCTGVKKFACYLCPKFFVKNSYVKKHINLVHNTKVKQQVENVSIDQNLHSVQVIETKDKDNNYEVQDTLHE